MSETKEERSDRPQSYAVFTAPIFPEGGFSVRCTVYGFSVILILVPLLFLSSCVTNEKIGQTVGEVLSGVGGYAAGKAIGGKNTAALGADIGGRAGGLLGGEIGKRLDERDQRKAEEATAQVLNAPPQTAEESTIAEWYSARNPGVYGHAKVVAIRPTAYGGECRTVREVAYIHGKEVIQNTTYCRVLGGRSWRVA
jgi:surface antigen